MNPLSLSEALKIAKATDFKNVVICPPFPFLIPVKNHLRKAGLGAQDIFWGGLPTGGGAYTGEVSGVMLKKSGASFVIIGHSERRRVLGETDEIINKKIKVALAAGLRVVLCIGEPAEVRKKGETAAKIFVKSQLTKDLKNILGRRVRAQNLIVAYEPVWAISTSRDPKLTETPEMIVQMIRFIKNLLGSKFKVQGSRILYGGSVTAENIERIIKHKEIDGALVGGASLKPVEFKKIIQIAKKNG
ncbi:MAG: triosephosphate isomerase (TIM) [Parcubacteria group bacterium Gr01-1014_20]|nr:MAG: triosephosphate isomerase (TIM) [Parcubacteria group bacterium Gr01-1014_20]